MAISGFKPNVGFFPKFSADFYVAFPVFHDFDCEINLVACQILLILGLDRLMGNGG